MKIELRPLSEIKPYPATPASMMRRWTPWQRRCGSSGSANPSWWTPTA